MSALIHLPRSDAAVAPAASLAAAGARLLTVEGPCQHTCRRVDAAAEESQRGTSASFRGARWMATM